MSEQTLEMISKPSYWLPIICSIAMIVLVKKFQPKIIGFFGELWTKRALKRLPKDKYKVINDLLILVKDKTHQIDHVVVSPYGIFSIETKQYNGFITGDKYDKKWVRHVRKKKIYYMNPIRQNYGHVKALCELLNIEESKVHNIVCIPSRATLRIKHDGELVNNLSIVDKLLSYNDVVIDNMEGIINFLYTRNIEDRKALVKHIKDIKRTVEDIDEDMCPKCGGELIERTGKYGIFIGCSNYPKCKYTRK